MKTIRCCRYAGLFFAATLAAQITTFAQGVPCTNTSIIGWGKKNQGEATPPIGLTHVMAMAAGYYCSLALRDDGTVVVWGDNTYGQTNVPAGLTNAVAVAAGVSHNLALKSDGTVVAWGDGYAHDTNVPAGLTSVVAIAAGNESSLALKTNGTVVAWGNNYYGETNVPKGLSSVVQIAAGWYHNVALKSDGTVVAWGDNTYGATNVPPGLTNIVAVSAGASDCLALKADGTVVAWGTIVRNFMLLPASTNVPSGLSNVVQVVAGDDHDLALTSDGTVVAWGDNYGYGALNVPLGLRATALAPGGTADHVLAIGCMVETPEEQFYYLNNGDGTCLITGYAGSGGDVAIVTSINGLAVTGIGSSAFAGVDNVTSVTIPNTITSIDTTAFYRCTNLTAITVDVANSFYSSTDGVLFDKNQTTLVAFPTGKAGSYTVPAGVTQIGSDAFAGAGSLTSVTIPAGVTNIGAYAFYRCPNLTAITVDAANSFYSSADGVLFDKNQTTLLAFPTGKIGSYNIPDGVTDIAVDAFGHCTGLTSVTIPNSVTSIENYAFEYCTGLTSIAIPDGITYIGTYGFYGCSHLGYAFRGILFTTLEFPGADQTEVTGISGSTVIGSYSYIGAGINYGLSHNFIYDGSTFTTVDIPQSFQSSTGAASFTGISGSNIVGYYLGASGTDQNGNTIYANRSFIYNGSTFTNLDVPGALSTAAKGISGGIVAGNYTDRTDANHGFIYDGSTFTTVDFPGATHTEIVGISGATTLGSYQMTNQSSGYFIYDGSTFTTLDVSWLPGALGISGFSGGIVVGNPGFVYDGSVVKPVVFPGVSATQVIGISGNTIFGAGINFTSDWEGNLAEFGPGFIAQFQTPGLQVSLTSSKTVTISWPYPSTGWTLQQNSDLTTTNWMKASKAVVNDGTNNFTIIDAPSGNSLYRLGRP